MALLFALRGNSLTPRYAVGGKAYANYLAAANVNNPAAVANLAHASVFGGQAINLIGLNDTRVLLYPSLGNWPSGSDVFSLLLRVVPDWTGNPAGVRRIIAIGTVNTPAFAGGILLEVQTDGTLYAVARGESDSGALIFNVVTTETFDFTSGVATDIMIVCDGSRVKISQEGVEKYNGALSNTGLKLNPLVAGAIRLGPYPWAGYYNEVVIWNSAEPHEYAPRTEFIACDEFDGTESTDPGEANVADGTEYVIDGVAKEGSRLVVTNITGEAILTGQALTATLREQ